LYVLVKNAWLSDDAFITFRVSSNLIHGFGPTWNVAERVQAFSNPLWMLLMAPFQLLSSFPRFVLWFSIAVSLVSVCLISGRGRNWRLSFLLVLVLIFSKAFIDYSTSGLENPLSFLLLAGVVTAFYRRKSRRRLLWTSLLTGLLLLNRLDLILLVGPLWVLVFIEEKGWRHLPLVAVTFLPIFLWWLFSFLYYGTPLPNTMFVKMASDRGLLELLSRGLGYLLNSLHWDPLTLITTWILTMVGLLYGFGKGGWVLLGVPLTFLYLIFIGGDFMSGRFLAAPPLLCHCLLYPGRGAKNSRFSVGTLPYWRSLYRYCGCSTLSGYYPTLRCLNQSVCFRWSLR
jgi:arabinofuranosyltransferase